MKLIIVLALLSLAFSSNLSCVWGQGKSKTQYMCSPCGNDCDKDVYDKPGKCDHCGMERVVKNDLTFTNISPHDLCRRVSANKDVVLLDVRSVKEFNGTARPHYGRLKNAINIPIDQLESRLGELKQYKDREIIVYCSHSQRSPRASHLLTQNGFSSVKNMSGGLSVWDESVKDDCHTALLVK